MAEVTYNGVYQPLRGVQMSRAYESTLDISFEVRGGLFVRQIHHWAALMFAAVDHGAPGPHLLHRRVPPSARNQLGDRLAAADPGRCSRATSATRCPTTCSRASACGRRSRRSRWACPVVGTWMHWALFGGDFPRRRSSIPRLYALHILLLPGIILALIGVHLALVWFQKHTQFPGPGRTETNVVGVRVMPVFAVKSGAFFAMITGILGLMGGLLQINPIWQLGPVQAVAGVGGQPARLLHDVDRRA